jgi:metallo-beta-lactamase class B
MIRILAVLLLFGSALPASAQDAEQRREWNQPHTPFRLIGNVYYVGTAGLSAFLITGPKGHVLIDGALPESAPLIAANVRQLGFKLTDIRYLLINHAHVDHAGGLAELKRLTGAKLLASEGDAPSLAAGRTIGRSDIGSFPPVRVDRIVKDGEIVRIGPIALIAHLTPGHTRGATSWSTVTDGKTVLFASSLTTAGQRLSGDPSYPHVADDFRRSFARLRALEVDVFVNFHPEFFDLARKEARLKRGDATAFVDPGELARRVDDAERAFAVELRRQQLQPAPR